MRRRSAPLGAAIVAGLLLASTVATPAAAFDPTTVDITLTPVISGLSQPVFVTHAGDGTGRLFIVEKGGRIRVWKNGSLLPTPFLDLSSKVSKGGEQGLLGLAFHPSFELNRKFYVNFTTTTGATAINEYRASATNPDVTQAGSGRRLLTIGQPYANHNGGMIAFDKAGWLFIGMGDGGSAGDPGNRAQNLDTLLGKMLRIGVNGKTGSKQYHIPSTNPYVGKAGRDEIWSRGFRNPWRFSFDRLTGNLWIGDVGQGSWEEIQRAPTSTKLGRGLNFGWRVMEGRHCYSPKTGCNTSGKIKPTVEYSHSLGCSVTGGYVYRGSASPGLHDGYFYGDYCSGRIWAVSSWAPYPATGTQMLDTSLNISSFGEDEAGELYVVDLGGDIYRIDEV
jgi:glucose/arabinose dehydrogenase